MAEDAIDADLSRVTVLFAIGPIAYTVATLTALINPWLSLGMFVLLGIFFMLPLPGQDPA